jgi:hypothetical protein
MSTQKSDERPTSDEDTIEAKVAWIQKRVAELVAQQERKKLEELERSNKGIRSELGVVKRVDYPEPCGQADDAINSLNKLGLGKKEDDEPTVAHSKLAGVKNHQSLPSMLNAYHERVTGSERLTSNRQPMNQQFEVLTGRIRGIRRSPNAAAAYNLNEHLDTGDYSVKHNNNSQISQQQQGVAILTTKNTRMAYSGRKPEPASSAHETKTRNFKNDVDITGPTRVDKLEDNENDEELLEELSEIYTEQLKKLEELMQGLLDAQFLTAQRVSSMERKIASLERRGQWSWWEQPDLQDLEGSNSDTSSSRTDASFEYDLLSDGEIST